MTTTESNGKPSQIDRKLPMPLYRQVETRLREKIASGHYAPGEMMPSVRELREEFGGINHLTVRQAIKNLEADNLVRLVQGRGAFVTEPKKTGDSIALVLPDLECESMTKIARGVQHVLDAQGARTVIMDSRGDAQKELVNISHLEDLPLAGAIIYAIPYEDIAERIFRLKMDGFPLVLVDRVFSGIPISSVTVDNYQGSYDLTKLLISRGGKRMGWMGECEISTSWDRFEGFREALNDHGVVWERRLTKKLPTLPTKETIREVTCELMNQPEPPRVIVCQNDSLALVVLQELKRLGLRVPQDVAVTGFDNIAEAANAEPPLTTVQQPMEQIGEEAARLLLELLQNPSAPPRKIVLPVHLIERGSS